MRTKIFIDGEAGTTGLQIRERLALRDDVELISLGASRRKDMQARAEMLNAADIAILCLPDDAARESVSLIENAHTRVIDASSAHRVMDGWTYGFAEMDASQSARIAAARFVANPGCWPQGVIAVMRPLVEAGLLPADLPITVNGVSGYSGGGKSMIAEYEAGGQAQFTPYALNFEHKHLPEMTQYAGVSVTPLFQPAVGHFAQGMLTAVPVQLCALENVPTIDQLHEALSAHYEQIPNSFVSVAPLERVAKLAALDPERLVGTNKMELFVFGNDTREQAVLMAVYDNLGKGASGAAVQNLNLMIGAAPDLGLEAA